jgi:hypothetical protein
MLGPICLAIVILLTIEAILQIESPRPVAASSKRAPNSGNAPLSQEHAERDASADNIYVFHGARADRHRARARIPRAPDQKIG